jgi:hypothetical protein
MIQMRGMSVRRARAVRREGVSECIREGREKRVKGNLIHPSRTAKYVPIRQELSTVIRRIKHIKIPSRVICGHLRVLLLFFGRGAVATVGAGSGAFVVALPLSLPLSDAFAASRLTCFLALATTACAFFPLAASLRARARAGAGAGVVVVFLPFLAGFFSPGLISTTSTGPVLVWASTIVTADRSDGDLGPVDDLTGENASGQQGSSTTVLLSDGAHEDILDVCWAGGWVASLTAATPSWTSRAAALRAFCLSLTRTALHTTDGSWEC